MPSTYSFYSVGMNVHLEGPNNYFMTHMAQKMQVASMAFGGRWGGGGGEAGSPIPTPMHGTFMQG